MNRLLKTEAIVLKKKPLLNEDSVITFLTSTNGRIRAYAHGIKKITSKRLPHTQTGNLVSILLRTKDEHYYLQESEIISAFQKIKADTRKNNMIYFMFFVIDRLTPENQEDEALYVAVKRFMIDVSEKKTFSKELLTAHINEILAILGYAATSTSFDALRLSLEEIIQEKLPLFSI